ncbi:cation:proton antiporter, partial [Pseudomonas aeruginosa]|uniref:cation:proton antiporter domain-containing protein n=1 Tax=Pseudomonas aeruginosa TaxID=287 RepID=UPI003968C0DC
ICHPRFCVRPFTPPQLFLDGWRIPKDAFFRDMKPILSLAIGLVMVTILVIGLFIHWVIPSITGGVSYVLASI